MQLPNMVGIGLCWLGGMRQARALRALRDTRFGAVADREPRRGAALGLICNMIVPAILSPWVWQSVLVYDALRRRGRAHVMGAADPRAACFAGTRL